MPDRFRLRTPVRGDAGVHRRGYEPAVPEDASLGRMTRGMPSASGARLAGDDYQHLLTWVHALKLLLVDGGVTKIEFEADEAGNVDDLVVHRIDEPTLYHQIKFVTSNLTPLTHEWFTTPPARSKRSPLQRFYESDTRLTAAEGSPPEMALHTNRLPTP